MAPGEGTGRLTDCPGTVWTRPSLDETAVVKSETAGGLEDTWGTAWTAAAGTGGGRLRMGLRTSTLADGGGRSPSPDDSQNLFLGPSKTFPDFFLDFFSDSFLDLFSEFFLDFFPASFLDSFLDFIISFLLFLSLQFLASHCHCPIRVFT